MINLTADQMKTDRKKVRLTGILLILGMVAGMLSIAPAVDSPDFLVQASENAIQVTAGAIFQFIMSVTYLGVAIALYPILRRFSKTLALGFLCFRMVAATLNIIGALVLLGILTLSQEYVKIAPGDPSYFMITGNLLRTGRDLVNHVLMILTLSVGGLMFYFLLFRTKLIPRWLALWGLSGTLFTIAASLLILLRIIDVITTIYLVLNLPLVLLEIVLAIWFIVKGFDSRAISSSLARHE